MTRPAGAIYSKAYKLWGVGEKEGDVSLGQWHWYNEEGALVFSRLHREDGGPSKDTHYYKEDGSVYVEMQYDAKYRGTPTVYINHDFDWQSRLQDFVNRSSALIPLSARTIKKVPESKPLSYQIFNEEGRVLCWAGVPYEKAVLSKVKRILKAKPDEEEIPARLENLETLFSDFADEYPDAKTSLEALTDSKPSVLAEYKKFRSRVLDAFADEF